MAALVSERFSDTDRLKVNYILVINLSLGKNFILSRFFSSIGNFISFIEEWEI